MHRLCDAQNQNYIYKAVDAETKHVYVFVGDTTIDANIVDALSNRKDLSTTQEDALKELFGKKWKSQLGMDISDKPIHIINKPIYADDSLVVVRWKLFTYIQSLSAFIHDTNHLYLWYEQKLNAEYIDLLLYELFIAGTTYIPAKTLLNTLQVQCNKDNLPPIEDDLITMNVARAYIESCKIKKAYLPLELKYLDKKRDNVPIHGNPYNPIAIDEMFTNEEGEYRPNYELNTISQSVIGKCTTLYFTTSKALFDAANTALEDESKNRVFHGIIKKYFPKLTEPPNKQVKLTKQTTSYMESVAHADELIQVTRNHQLQLSQQDCYLTRLHLSIHPKKDIKLDIESLFARMQTSPKMPFLEFRDINNNVYKINRNAISERKTHEDIYISNDALDQWTNMQKHINDPTIIGRIQRKNRSLRIKLYLNRYDQSDCFFSLIVFDNCAYDIKYKFLSLWKVDLPLIEKTLQSVSECLSCIEDTLSLPPQTFHVLDESLFNMRPPPYVEFVECEAIHDATFLQNIAKINGMRKCVEQLYPFAEVLTTQKDNSSVSFKYKRVNNFMNMDAVDEFLSRNYELDKPTLIQLLQKNYGLSEADAENAYTNKSDKLKLDIIKKSSSLLYKPRYNNGIFVQVMQQNQITIKCVLKGLHSFGMVHVVCEFVHSLSNANVLKDHLTKLSASEKKALDNLGATEQKDNANVSLKVVEDILADADGDADFDADDVLDLEDEDNDLLDAFSDVDDEDIVTETHATTEPALTPAKPQKEQDDDDVDDHGRMFNPDDFNVDDINDPVTRAKYEKSAIKLMMTRLINADKELFKYEASEKFRPYSIRCQTNIRRQPVVLTQEEKDHVDQNYPNSYDGYVQTGSTEDKKQKNYYICPRIWCPLSNVTLTEADLKKYHNRCPPPYKEHPIRLHDSSHWQIKDANGNVEEKPRYPGFLKSSLHPSGYEMPCCFKTQNKLIKRVKASANKKHATIVDPQDMEAEHMNVNDRYICKQGVVEPNRYGMLPDNLANYFDCMHCYGLIKEDTDYYVRKGVVQDSNSFFACMVQLLQNDNIKNVEDLIDHISTRMTPDEYMTLNGGNTLKVFYNDDETIHDPENFARFREWFLAQKDYIRRFDLSVLAKKLELNSNVDKISDDMYREYMIYNSFTNFVYYLRSSISKHHEECMDLMSPRFTWLNNHAFNLIVLEAIDATKEIMVHCPKYISAKQDLDMTRPFVYIIKQDRNYEIICHVAVRNGVKRETCTFSYLKHTYTRRVADLLNKGCISSYNEPWKQAKKIHSVALSLGQSIDAYVLNMSFKVCGMVTAEQLYIPFATPIPLVNLGEDRELSYMYAHDLYKLRPSISVKRCKAVLKRIGEKLDMELFKNVSVIDENNTTIALLLNDICIVPVAMNKDAADKWIRQSQLDNGIFLEGLRPASDRTQLTFDKLTKYNASLESVARFMLRNETYTKRLYNIRHPLNPLPEYAKKQQIADLLEVYESVVGDKLKKTTKEQLLDDLYLKDLSFILKSLQVTVYQSHEYVLDQFDISQNKLLAIRGKLQNPYRYISAAIEDYVQYAPLLGSTSLKRKHKVNVPIALDSLTEIKPAVRWQTIMPDMRMHDIDHTSWKNDYLLGLLHYAARLRKQKVTVELMNTYLINQMQADYKADGVRFIKELLLNSSFRKITESIPTPKLLNSSFDDILTFTEDDKYLYSYYELEKLSRFVGVNVVLIGRENKQKFPMGIRCFYNNSNTYVVFQMEYFTDYEIYRIVVRERDMQMFFSEIDFTKEFRMQLRMACMRTAV